MCYLECFEIATSSKLFQLLKLYRVFRNSLDTVKYSLGQHILQYEHGRIFFRPSVCTQCFLVDLYGFWSLWHPPVWLLKDNKLYNITKGVCHRAVTLSLLYIWHVKSPDIVTDHISVDFQFQLNRLVNKEVSKFTFRIRTSGPKPVKYLVL